MTIFMNRLSPVLLVIAALVSPLLVSVEALTRRPGAVSMEASSIQQRKLSHNRADTVAFVVSAPRGGEANDDNEGGVEAEAGDEEDETEDEEEIVEAAVEEIQAEVEELVEEVAEEAVEELVEEVVEEVEAADEEVDAAEEEVDEEEVEVVFPTDEIPSDDVRSFHTTDGELADDEGVYTDGQNESPIIADNEAAEDTIGATEESADGGANEEEEEVEDGESALAVPTAVRAGASVAVIDDSLKKVLITELRYTEEDVANMRPEIAQEVVDNKLAKPTEGMPKNWYSDPELANKEESLLEKKKGLILTVAAVGAVALSVGVLKDNDSIGDTVEEIVDALKSIPKAIAAFVVAAKKSGTGSIPKTKKLAPVPTETVEEPEEEKKEDASATQDASVQSIKPGTSANEVPDSDVDTTWLDKALTRIGGAFKKFMNAKI